MTGRGQARLIEAILTIALILPFSIYLLGYYAPPSYPDAPLYDAAATAVTALDRGGVLLPLLLQNSTVGLYQAFRSSLPSDVDFAVAYSKGDGALVRLGPSQFGPNPVRVGFVVVAPDGTAFRLTLIAWRR